MTSEDVSINISIYSVEQNRLPFSGGPSNYKCDIVQTDVRSSQCAKVATSGGQDAGPGDHGHGSPGAALRGCQGVPGLCETARRVMSGTQVSGVTYTPALRGVPGTLGGPKPN
ncbi:hypothetical protein TNCV_2722211 [Trichonephila clavipes]|nr:hypothetical protein TNCV_2722211 [Trichonephila clavipes]